MVGSLAFQTSQPRSRTSSASSLAWDDIQDLVAARLRLKEISPIRERPDPASRVLLTGMTGQVVNAIDCAAWGRGDDWLEVALVPGAVTGWIERRAVRPFDSHGSRWAETLQHMLAEAGQAMQRRTQAEAATFSAHGCDSLFGRDRG
jgi:hypothetical protein